MNLNFDSSICLWLPKVLFFGIKCSVFGRSFFWNDHLRMKWADWNAKHLQLPKQRWIHDKNYIMFFFGFRTLNFFGEKVFWRNGSTNKHKASGGRIPAAFAAKAGFDPSSNPGGPAMGSRGAPLKQMPVNMAPPPKAKAGAS